MYNCLRIGTALLRQFQSNLEDNMTQIVLPEIKRVETEKERGLRGACRYGQEQFNEAVQTAFRGFVRLVIRVRDCGLGEGEGAGY